MISDIKIPDSKIAREAGELVRQHESEKLFNHSVLVFLFGAKGSRQNLTFGSETSSATRKIVRRSRPKPSQARLAGRLRCATLTLLHTFLAATFVLRRSTSVEMAVILQQHRLEIW